MPWGLKRFQQSGQTHFVTFCCYHRRLLFTEALAKRIFEPALETGTGHSDSIRLYRAASVW